MDSGSIILFAIRSVIRLGEQARTAYMDATRRKELVLPMSDFFGSTSIDDAINYFTNPEFGEKYVKGDVDGWREGEGSVTLERLLGKLKNQLGEREKLKLMSLHQECVNMDRAGEGRFEWRSGERVSQNELEALFRIHQWRKGEDPTPSALQRMAGVLIEMGIDYARISPDFLERNSKKGRALVGLLNGLDEIKFSEAELSELPSRLFVATMETLSECADLVSGDIKIQEFIKVSTKALSVDVAGKIRKINEDEHLDAVAKREARLHAQDWGELIFRSTLSSGAGLIVSNPARYMGIEERWGEALVSAVGGSVLDLVLSGDGKLEGVFSREGVEKVIKAGLQAVGDHPEILEFTKHKGVRELLYGIAEELTQIEDLLSPDILPEIARLILEKSGENIRLLWPDLAGDPKKNLLLVAAKRTLEILCAKPVAGDRWKTRFGRNDVLRVTEAVLDELIANPGWLINEAGDVSASLGEVLQSTLGVLRKYGDDRLSPAVGTEILQEVIKSMVLRQDFVTKRLNGEPLAARTVEAIMATIFGRDLDAEVAWQLVRGEVVAAMSTLALERMARSGLDQDAVKRLNECLGEQIKTIKEGKVFTVDQFAECLDHKLKPA